MCGEQHINQTWVALNNYDHVDFNIYSSGKIKKLDIDVVQLSLCKPWKTYILPLSPSCF